jgi:tetratricopeptide (TPR) repeat protein
MSVIDPRDLRTRRAAAVLGVGLVWAAFLASVGLFPTALLAVLGAFVASAWVLGVQLPRYDVRVLAGAAKQRLPRIRRADPSTAAELVSEAALLRRRGRVDDAVEAAQEAVERFARDGDLQGQALAANALGLALAQAGRHAEALEALDSAIELLARCGDRHHEGQVLVNLGALHSRVGRTESARSCWTKALVYLEPGTPESERAAELLVKAS